MYSKYNMKSYKTKSIKIVRLGILEKYYEYSVQNATQDYWLIVMK